MRETGAFESRNTLTPAWLFEDGRTAAADTCLAHAADAPPRPPAF